jgi:hypothetical protein
LVALFMAEDYWVNGAVIRVGVGMLSGALATTASGLKSSAGSLPAPRYKVYSAPRRFDLATIFVVTAAFSVLFASMSALRLPPLFSAGVAGFISLVGSSQALLFRGQRPRTASLIVGAVACSLLNLAAWMGSGFRAYATFQLWLGGIYSIIGGAFLGYVAGAFVGGVFLVADVLRGRFGGPESN